MAFKFFVVPVRAAGAAEEEMNRFLRGYRVLAVAKQWVEAGENSFWSFCVDYIEGAVTEGSGGARVDYKEVLSAEDFELFAKLRELRKEIAGKAAVPVYAIFTNEQLAAMAQRRPRNGAALQEIEGIGAAKAERFGAEFLALIGRVGSPEAAGDPGNEAQRKAD